jgi:hypothetical protein
MESGIWNPGFEFAYYRLLLFQCGRASWPSYLLKSLNLPSQSLVINGMRLKYPGCNEGVRNDRVLTLTGSLSGLSASNFH